MSVGLQKILNGKFCQYGHVLYENNYQYYTENYDKKNMSNIERVREPSKDHEWP